MIIRPFRENDLDQLKEIHEKYYKEEFRLENFLRPYLFGVICANDDDFIISAGVLRFIFESCIMTDKDFSSRIRRDALLQILRSQLLVTGRLGGDTIHAFVQDDKWFDQLKRYGFKEPKGKALFLG